MKKLIITSENPPEDFQLLAQNMRTLEVCGYTNETGYKEVTDIPYGYHQKCLPGEYGDKHMSLNEIKTARMTMDGDILLLQALITAMIPDIDPVVAKPFISSMSRKTSGDLNFEPFTATQTASQILRKGLGYFDPLTGARGVWVGETQECGDPAWAPGGIAYVNWRIIPLISADGTPLWAMGVYVYAGSVWEYDSVRYRSLRDQEQSVLTTDSVPDLWEKLL